MKLEQNLLLSVFLQLLDLYKFNQSFRKPKQSHYKLAS